MAYKPIKLADSVRVECNNCLDELKGLREDILKAERAKVPGMDALHARCQECEERIASLKAEYFPNKR